MTIAARKLAGLLVVTVIVAGVSGFFLSRWLSAPTPMPADQLASNGGTFVGTFLGMSHETVPAETGRNQARAMIRMRTQGPVRVGRENGWEEFERFKESEMLSLKSTTFLTAVAARADVRQVPLLAKAEDKSRALRERLQLRWESPEVLSVMFNGEETDQLKRVLTGIVDEYLARATEEDRVETAKSQAQVEATLNELDAKIKTIRDLLVKRATVNPPMSAAEEIYLNTEHRGVLRDLKQFEAKRADVQSRLKQLKSLEGGDPDLITRVVDSTPAVRRRVTEAEAALQTLKDFKATLRADSPRVAEAERSHAAAVAAVEAERKAARATVVSEFQDHQKQRLAAEGRQLESELQVIEGQLDATRKDRQRIETRLQECRMPEPGRSREMEELSALRDQREIVVKQKIQAQLQGNPEPRVTLKEAVQLLLNHNIRTRHIATLSVTGADGTERPIRVILYTNDGRKDEGFRARRFDAPNGSRVSFKLAPHTPPQDLPVVMEWRIVE